jgi:hypothetical protein
LAFATVGFAARKPDQLETFSPFGDQTAFRSPAKREAGGFQQTIVTIVQRVDRLFSGLSMARMKWKSELAHSMKRRPV